MRFPFRLKLPVVAYISLSLVGLTACVLIAVSYLGLFPDAKEERQRSRQQLCETSAICISLVAQRTDSSSLRAYLDQLSKRRSDIKSLAVRRTDGSVVVSTGDHNTHWDAAGAGNQMWVQLYANGKPWGKFEAAFNSNQGKWLTSTSETIHLLVVTGLCFCVFYFYLRVVLRQLDPSKVVPTRVREALDTLAEGLVILDRDERIVLANQAFEDATGKSETTLLGASVDNLAFVNHGESDDASSPWKEALRNHSSVTGRLLDMHNDGDASRTFSVSASPIVDDRGNTKGTLATFEDVTKLEDKKRELAGMVEYLRESSDAIKKQNRELEILATRDSLTGCLNRRTFFNLVDAEWQTAQRYDRPLSAMMVDIDFFKSVNDNHGHSAGDKVLLQVARLLLGQARESDIVCRYGGEEFSIFLPMTDIDGAELFAERIRRGLEELEFPGFAITASIGVSTRTGETEQPQDLLEQADKCLYLAKRNGRNRVVRWDNVPEDVVIDESKVSRTSMEDDFEPVSVPYHAVTALISALAYRDQKTAAHSRRVADLCVATAEGLFSLKDCYMLEIAALLHDIGKVGVPDNILLKPGQLTAEEWDVMKRNDTIGKEIVRASFACPQLTSILDTYQTHYEGQGSKIDDGSAREIPVGARILAIADAYDAMTTDRVFRAGCRPQEAFDELRRCAGSQFDPELVERFIGIIHDRRMEEAEKCERVSKETALVIGLQIERLSEALDAHDYEKLEAMSMRLQTTAQKYGIDSISETAQELFGVLKSDRNEDTIIQLANEILDLCRATQHSFLDVETVHGEMVDKAPKEQDNSRKCGSRLSQLTS